MYAHAKALVFRFFESFFWTTFLLFRSAQARGSLTAWIVSVNMRFVDEP